MSKFTPDEIEDTFHACLQAGDADGVEICLRAMAGADPARAVRLYDDLKTTVTLAIHHNATYTRRRANEHARGL